MQDASRQFIQRLQNMLGLLECEFLYLVRDMQTGDDDGASQPDMAASKLALAAYCVERASRIVNDEDVVKFLEARIDSPAMLAG